MIRMFVTAFEIEMETEKLFYVIILAEFYFASGGISVIQIL